MALCYITTEKVVWNSTAPEVALEIVPQVTPLMYGKVQSA